MSKRGRKVRQAVRQVELVGGGGGRGGVWQELVRKTGNMSF